jgi:hypothetical protein
MAFEVAEGDLLAVEVLEGEGRRGLAAQRRACRARRMRRRIGRVGNEVDAGGLLALAGEAALAQVLVAGPHDERDSGDHEE